MLKRTKSYRYGSELHFSELVSSTTPRSIIYLCGGTSTLGETTYGPEFLAVSSGGPCDQIQVLLTYVRLFQADEFKNVLCQ